jgi:SAM-dependent methyltransferase
VAGAAALPPALGRAYSLLERSRRPLHAEAERGYVDLLGPEAPPSTGPAQRLMRTSLVPAVYERWWRPAWSRFLKGAFGPGMADEHRIARLLLALSPGDGVLDVACGPGNYTRDFGRVVGETGLAIGIDASETMLARAVRDTPARDYPSIGYIRCDAARLPFRDESFDAVCCFAALHLLRDPFAALDHMARVLTLGGRIAILTTCRTRSAPLRTVDGFIGARSGIKMFEHEEITAALEARGVHDIRRRVSGLIQIVGGRRG